MIGVAPDAASARVLQRYERRGPSLLAALMTTEGGTSMETTHRYRRLVEPVKRVATDRQVHRQSRRAAADVAGAIRRAGRVGIADAMTDRRVACGLRRAGRHASRALVLTIAPPPSHKKRNAAIVALGVGGITAGAIAARHSFQPAGETPTPVTSDGPVGESPDTAETAQQAPMSAQAVGSTGEVIR